MIRLLPGLLGMLGENIDILDKSLGLLDSYLLLDAAGIIQVGHDPMFARTRVLTS